MNMRKILASRFILACCCIIFSSASLAARDDKKLKPFIDNKNFAWQKYETPHFVIYVEKQSFAEENIEALKVRMEAIRTNTLVFMGVDGYDKRLYVFLLPSRERMKLLTNYEGNGFARPELQTVFEIYSPRLKGVSNHEPFHVFANNLWGSAKETFVSEGMAVYSDDRWHSFGLHPLAKFLKDKGKLISANRLVSNFRNENDLITYPQSGSFVKFLCEKYGKDKMRKIWKDGQKAFKKTYGKNLDEVEKEWLSFLDGQDASKISYQGW